MEDSLNANNGHLDSKIPTKEVIVWADGCYDIGHFGHANSLRQAQAFGTCLIVGVHSNKEIKIHKSCEPVFDETERCAMVEAMQFVNKVVKNAPYVTTLDTLETNKAKFCAHGDDITTTKDGVDTYQIIKDAGRYKEVHRTHGVSTTNIIQRILNSGETPESPDYDNSSCSMEKSQFILTTETIQQFSSSKKKRKDGDVVVYAAGAFDIFHPGHIEFLAGAAALGDYLIIGVYDDVTVRAYKGSSYPILTLPERLLSVLACKYVDNVIIAPPYTVTNNFIQEFNVGIVAHGRQNVAIDPFTGKDPYALPKELDKLRNIYPKSEITTKGIIDRVQKRRVEFVKRNALKMKREKELSETKQLNVSTPNNAHTGRSILLQSLN